MDDGVDQGRRGARAFAASVVWLRYLIVLAWAAAAVAAVLVLPSLDEVGSDASGLVKENSNAIAAQQRSAEVFGYPLLTEVAVVQRNPDGLSSAAQTRVVDRAAQISARGDTATNGLRAAVPVINVDGAM